MVKERDGPDVRLTIPNVDGLGTLHVCGISPFAMPFTPRDLTLAFSWPLILAVSH